MTREDETGIEAACAAFNAAPSSFDLPISNALALIARLEAVVPRIEAAMALLTGEMHCTGCGCHWEAQRGAVDGQVATERCEIPENGDGLPRGHSVALRSDKRKPQ